MRSYIVSVLLAGAAASVSHLVDKSYHSPGSSPLMSQISHSSAYETTAGNTTVRDPQAAAWEAAVATACAAQLDRLTSASNPSGVSICYNIPALNPVSGQFAADLRLYMVSQPVGAFAGIPPDQVQVDLTYTGAAVVRVGPRSGVTARALPPVDISSSLILLQQYTFLGQINISKVTVDMSDPMSGPQVEALIMPALTLSATNPTGATISTAVSLNEAAFLVGVFSSDGTLPSSAFSRADAAVAQQLARLHAGQVAFVLPGVQLLIFPVGLVLTTGWLALGLVAYGVGSWQRLRYRNTFLSRLAAAQRRRLSVG